jgi:pimeloyl-ACP methyl ester carboxylesterase
VKQVIDVDGIELHLEGDGPTVLMVHGWPDTYRLWDRQVAALRGRYRCARFTLPGFDTAAPPRPASLDETVELLRRMARAACPTAASRCCCTTGAACSASRSTRGIRCWSSASSRSTSATPRRPNSSAR